MDIETPLRELGAVDSSALAKSILGQGQEAWREELHRQKSYDVHQDTESIVMVFTELDDWPTMTVKKEPGWDRLVDVAVPVMHDIIGRFYPKGGTIIRAMAAKLLAGKKIKPHRDVHPSFHRGHRIHVPISTNPRDRAGRARLHVAETCAPNGGHGPPYKNITILMYQRRPT